MESIYRLFDLKERKIVIARDVLFFEEIFDKTENEYKIETERKEGEQYEIDFGMKEENKSGEEAKETELEDNFLSASSDDNDHDYDDIETIANRVVARKEQNRPISGRFGESKRVMGHKNRYLHAVVEKPNSVKEAHESPQNREWKNAMQTEYNALTKNNTWSLVTCPENKNVIGSKWVFTTKHNADGTIDRYKARLVAQGCTQVAGIDYTYTFASVVRHSTIRLILSLAVQCKLLVNHVDVVSAYLNGDLEEEVYMREPEGFIDKNFPKKVCKLNK